MITRDQAAGAVMALRICRYFPVEEFQRAQVGAVLVDMVSTKSELDWLIQTQVKIGEWKGLGELRGIFCARFSPADRIYTEAKSAGFSIGDIEMEHIEREGQRSMRALAEARREMKLLGEAPVPMIDVTQALKCVPAAQVKSRTEEALDQQTARKRLASVIGGATAPIRISIPATPKRTEEENNRIARDIEAQLEQRKSSRA